MNIFVTNLLCNLLWSDANAIENLWDAFRINFAARSSCNIWRPLRSGSTCNFMKPTTSAVATRRYSCRVSSKDIPFLSLHETQNIISRRGLKNEKVKTSPVQARHFNFSQAFAKSPIRKPPEMNSRKKTLKAPNKT